MFEESNVAVLAAESGGDDAFEVELKFSGDVDKISSSELS